VVPPCSDRIARVPPYSSLQLRITCTGLSPTEAQLSRRFHLSQLKHWPDPRSLATTSGVSVDVLSSGYLDVSVPRVRFLNLWIQFRIPLRVGFPIRKFTDQSLFAAPRDLSQRTTSFIASQRQGIHRTPLRHLITLIVDARRPLEGRTRSTEERPVSSRFARSQRFKSASPCDRSLAGPRTNLLFTMSKKHAASSLRMNANSIFRGTTPSRTASPTLLIRGCGATTLALSCLACRTLAP
jgi:hypothetical protein